MPHRLPHLGPILLAAAFLSLTSSASADAIGVMPTIHCPLGSSTAFSHSVPYCRPGQVCTADADCGSGSCVAAAICVGELACGGNTTDDCRVPHTVSACDESGACASGDCATERRCAPPPPAPPPAASPPSSAPASEAPRSGGCAATPSAGAEAVAISTLLVVLCAAWRTARSPRSVARSARRCMLAP